MPKIAMSSVTLGSNRIEFPYDGLHRRKQIVEKTDGVVVSDTRVVWCGAEPCEERAASGSSAISLFEAGLADSSGTKFSVADHLGSTREMTGPTGTLLARYAHEPFGARTKVSGNGDRRRGFARYESLDAVGLELTLYRVYDPSLGRWLSEDPMGVSVGLNRYRHVGNAPTLLVDPLGLQQHPAPTLPNGQPAPPPISPPAGKNG
jgi:RHS repeat-associated protein